MMNMMNKMNISNPIMMIMNNLESVRKQLIKITRGSQKVILKINIGTKTEFIE